MPFFIAEKLGSYYGLNLSTMGPEHVRLEGLMWLVLLMWFPGQGQQLNFVLLITTVCNESPVSLRVILKIPTFFHSYSWV